FAWFSNIVSRNLERLVEAAAGFDELLAGFVRVAGNEEERRRVLAFEPLFHILGSGDALIVVHQNDVNRPPEMHQMIDAPGADGQQHENHHAVTERQFCSEVMHRLITCLGASAGGALEISRWLAAPAN